MSAARELFKTHILRLLHQIAKDDEELALDDLPATLFVVTDQNEPQIIDVSPAMQNDRTKDLFVDQMRKATANGEIIVSALVIGSWLSVQHQDAIDANGTVRPSQDPERESVLIVALEDAEGADVSVYTFDPEARELVPYGPAAERESPMQMRFVWFPRNVEAQEAVEQDLKHPKIVPVTPGANLNA